MGLLMAPPAQRATLLDLSWKNAAGGGLKSVKATYPRNGGLHRFISPNWISIKQFLSPKQSIKKRCLWPLRLRSAARR